MKFVKKPIVIEAFKWTGDEHQVEDPQWIIDAIKAGIVLIHNAFRSNTGDLYMTIKTLEGDHRANPGDYIIKGIKGELYPCKPDIFELTYQPVGSFSFALQALKDGHKVADESWQDESAWLELSEDKQSINIYFENADGPWCRNWIPNTSGLLSTWYIVG
jgi:hypothetical protein